MALFSRRQRLDSGPPPHTDGASFYQQGCLANGSPPSACGGVAEACEAKRLKDLEAGRANLVAGAPERACATAEETKAQAWRWSVHPATAYTPEPHLELRRRDGPDGRTPDGTAPQQLALRIHPSVQSEGLNPRHRRQSRFRRMSSAQTLQPYVAAPVARGCLGFLRPCTALRDAVQTKHPLR